MRLPVIKVLWGMFAFPTMYPAVFFRAVGVPLLGIVGVTLLWVSGAVSAEDDFLKWSLLFAKYGLFAWLAVRCHRMVLVGSGNDEQAPTAGIVRLVLRYLAALTAATILKNVSALFIALVALFSFGTQDVSAGESPPPMADPDVQRMLDYLAYAGQVPALYLLARWSPQLPAIALGHGWAPGAAWRQSSGNGWRLVIVVFLLPLVFDAAVDWTYLNTTSSPLVGLLAVATALFTALGILALSLAYRELPPLPAPPPKPPPA